MMRRPGRDHPVGGFSRREVLAYLSAQLTDYPDQRADALDLGADLDGLPLGLAQAAAVMTVDRLSCREYRGRFGERREHMSAMRVDGVSPAVLATWSLAAECAHQLPPAGVAWPALALAAMLDPDGIPGAVLTSPAGCGYIAGRPSAAEAADQTLVHAAMTNLARVGLVSVDPASPVRTVRMHASVQAAVRAYLPPADFEQAVLAAAEALMQTWPEAGERPRDLIQQGHLEQVLRDCTDALRAADSAVPAPAGGGRDGRPRAPRRGPAPPEQAVAARSPPGPFPPGAEPGGERAGRIRHRVLAGHAHHQHQPARQRARQHGDGPGPAGHHLNRRRASATPSRCFPARWPTGNAPRGPNTDTIAARGRLAHAYSSAGRPAEAAVLYEQIAAGARRGWAPASGHAGRPGQPGRRLPGRRPGQGSADRVPDADDRLRRLLGARHPSTLATRESLAAAFLANGQPKEAIEHYKRLVAEPRQRPAATPGRDRRARQPGVGLSAGGKPKDAIALYQRVLADRERIAGPDHPDAITARADLAFAYRSAGQCGRRSPPTSAPWPTGSGCRDRPRRHPVRAGQPGRGLPAGRAARRRHLPLRAGAGRQRADARAR